ncbi:MAG: hypothetical protein CMP14_03880 [Rickettsiales bacterium]|nr:hypothetical protein [Rickettsiales bacterium]|tara:strand:+ start:1251 stop:1544 length:294 start_codon:yes stop_codon:yes gene_type:complete
MIIKFITWLGRCLLKLLRLLFLNKAARRAIDRKPPAKPKTEIAEKSREGKSRKALIAEAVFLHRAQQDALSELDDESRKKLKKMAEKMMPKPPGKNS